MRAEIGDVRAGDEEHDANRAKQDQERHADARLEHRVVQALDPHAPVSIRGREFLLHAGGEALHFVPGLIQRHLRAQPSNHPQRVVTTALRRIHRQRDEDLRSGGHSDLRASDLAKRGRHDTDNLVAMRSGDRAADDGRIAKPAYP